MGYNLLAIHSEEPDWTKLHEDILDKDGAIELFPIKEDDGKHYLGVNIPYNKLIAHSNTWEQLEKVVQILRTKYEFQVFDLYGGFFVDDGNLMEVKKQLLKE
ncbi:MAG: hypothetical protein JKY54_15375 [Flavobacteriales bacterium]|nr:hypothetical protein [Flavobacteriales bacterium]